MAVEVIVRMSTSWCTVETRRVCSNPLTPSHAQCDDLSQYVLLVCEK